MSNLSTVQAIYEAFGQGNVPAILEHLADDVDWERGAKDHGVPWLKPGVGKAHVGKFFESIGAFQMTKFAPTNMLEGGHQVVAIIDVELTVDATGKSVSDQELHLWMFGPDGNVVAFRHVVDTAQHIAAFKG